LHAAKIAKTTGLSFPNLAFYKIQTVDPDPVTILRDFDENLEFSWVAGIFTNVSTETAGIFVLEHKGKTTGRILLKKIFQDNFGLVFRIFSLLSVYIHGDARVKKPGQITA